MWLSTEQFESPDVQALIRNGRLVVLKSPPGYNKGVKEAPSERPVQEPPPSPERFAEEPPSPPTSEVDTPVEVDIPVEVAGETEEPSTEVPSDVPVYTREELEKMTLTKLRPIASGLGMSSVTSARKASVIDFILESQ